MKNQIFTILLITALLIGGITFLIFSTPKNKQMKFIMEADTIKYKCGVIRSAAFKNPVTLCKNNKQVSKFLGDFKLVPKEACNCAHMDMLIFHNGKESHTVSICDHCFDILVKPAENGQPSVVDHYKMPDGLYQRFKAFQVDWESQQEITNNNPVNETNLNNVSFENLQDTWPEEVGGFNDNNYKTPEPGSWALELSENPTLVEARKYDLRFADTNSANQSKAEQLYLQFIEEEPDDPLIPYLYCRLGHLFTDFVSDELEKLGAIRSNEKALTYYEKSVESNTGKIDIHLIGSKVNIAALQPNSEDVVSKYIEYYKWLMETLETKKETLSQGVIGFINAQLEVAAANMVAEASGPPEFIRLDLLEQIVKELPDSEPARLANEEITKYMKFKEISEPDRIKQ